jgi:hypothetical protein
LLRHREIYCDDAVAEGGVVSAAISRNLIPYAHHHRQSSPDGRGRWLDLDIQSAKAARCIGEALHQSIKSSSTVVLVRKSGTAKRAAN